MFGNKIEVHLLEKDENYNFIKKAKFNIKSLDNHLKEQYTNKKLEKMLADSI